MALDTLDRPPQDDGFKAPAVVPGNAAMPADDYIPPSRLDPAMQFAVLKKWWQADADHSREWRAAAREAFAFRAGEQWKAEDRALLETQERPVIVFNRVLTILKAVAGMEINGRHEISFIPRGTEDTKVNEVLSAASKWMSDNCDGEDEESQAFDQTCTAGMGWVEDRMSYEDQPAGMYVEECVDCREMYWDRKARKKNLSDATRMARARRMAIADAVALFPGKTREQLDAVWADDAGLDYPLKSIEEKRRRNEDNTLGLPYEDQQEVTIVHMQWIERETYWMVADVANNRMTELSNEEYRVFAQRMAMLGMPVVAARLIRKVYKNAFLGGELLMPARDAPIKGQFSWKCITGEYDAVKGTWFGLVKVMRDPQMWANKWLSQILHILNSTAKGGILAETSAFDDQRAAEDGYARPDTITWLADGALSGDKPKVMPKPGMGVTDGFVGLMTFAISSIKDVTGINLELLGQQDQNQPGIIEAMRKQAGMTVLATLFDSLRRFRKQVGRTRLYFIQNYLSDGRLIRVAGQDAVRVVALAKDKTVGEYDVVVDDTPTSPNQKEANWAIIQPLLAVFRDQLIANPQVLGLLLEYSPLPSRIVEAIKAFIAQAQDDPTQQINQRLMIGRQVAAMNKDQSVAELNNAKAGATQATAVYDIAMAQNLLAKNDIDGLAAHLKMMQSAAEGEKVAAEAEKDRADALHKTASAHAVLKDSDTKRVVAVHDMRRKNMGDLIDRVATMAGAQRDTAAAHRDYVDAGRP